MSKKKIKMKRVECFKNTLDDWCPNFIGSKVRVSLLTNMANQDKIWHRVCVWGDDDCGMEMDFHGEQSIGEAQRIYNYIISLPTIEMATLKRLGFVGA